MRKIIVGEFLSLDGVMQAPGGVDEDREGGFALGGWVLQNWHDAVGMAIDARLQECDALLVGRKTWQSHAEAFAPSPEGDPFAGKKKYVVSTTLTNADFWQDSSVIRGNVAEEVRKLKQEPGKNIYIDGSCTLVHYLQRHDLIDEYALYVFPLLLGGGKRLFANGVDRNLSLIESTVLPNGVVVQRYAVKHP